jgi:hypothetical protein
VKTLRETKPGAGHERTLWNVRNAAPGVYLCQVKIKTAGWEIISPVKKFVITKIRR